MEGLLIIRRNFMISPLLSQSVYKVLPEHLLLCDILIPNKIREEDLFHPQPSYILNTVLWDSRFLNCFWPSDIALLQPSFGGTSEVGGGETRIITFTLGIKVYWLSLELQYQKSWLQKLPTYLTIWPPLFSTCQKHLLKTFSKRIDFFLMHSHLISISF